MCQILSKSEGVPFQLLGDLTWNDPSDASGDTQLSYCYYLLRKLLHLLGFEHKTATKPIAWTLAIGPPFRYFLILEN